MAPSYLRLTGVLALGIATLSLLLVRYAFEDGKAVVVCPTCQRPDEREIAAIAQHDD